MPSESNGKMIRSAMNPKVFLDLVESSRHQLTEREFAKITARVNVVIAESEAYKLEQYVSQRFKDETPAECHWRSSWIGIWQG